MDYLKKSTQFCTLKNFNLNLYQMKITVVGAGAVGATCADNIIRKELCEELVLLDIKEGFAEGKALDMTQTASLLGFDTKVTGSTNDYSKTAGSSVVVITSGIPRKPGMTREELIGINAGIVKGVCENILKHSPDAIIVVISNPMDTMTYLALQSTGLPKNRIIGMGGILDSSRFKTYLQMAMGCSQHDLQATVIGGHGDTTMIPLTRLATCQGVPVSKTLSADTLSKVAADTMVGGATLTALLGTSAWYAPGAAGAALIESIVRDEKRVFPCCVKLDGEYGQNDICLGVPVVIGKNGWEKIVELELNDEEKTLFAKSADAVRNMNSVLATLSI
jgi:malate dehydrogenase